MATLVSVNIGMPKDVSWRGRTVHTGVWKSPVEAPRMTTTSPPSRRTACAISTPTGPPPRIRSRGDRLHRGDLVAGPDALQVTQPRHRVHERLGAVREHHVRG